MRHFLLATVVLTLVGCTDTPVDQSEDMVMIEKRTENMDKEIHELKEKIEMLEKRTENMDKEIHELKE